MVAIAISIAVLVKQVAALLKRLRPKKRAKKKILAEHLARTQLKKQFPVKMMALKKKQLAIVLSIVRPLKASLLKPTVAVTRSLQ